MDYEDNKWAAGSIGVGPGNDSRGTFIAGSATDRQEGLRYQLKWKFFWSISVLRLR